MLIPTQRLLGLLCAALNQHVTSGSYDGPLHGAYVGLATAGPTPTKEVLRADYTEANYTGYARQALATPGSVFNGSEGMTKIVYGDLQFQPTDAVTPNVITHILLLDASTAGNLLGVVQLASTVSMSNALSALVYTPDFGFQQDISYGTGEVET